MPALGVWGVIKLVASLLPEIVDFVKSSVVWVEGAIDYVQTKQRAAQMLKAIVKAKQTGDTSDVEAIFNPKPTPRS